MRILCGMMLLLGMVAPMSHGQGASGEHKSRASPELAGPTSHRILSAKLSKWSSAVRIAAIWVRRGSSARTMVQLDNQFPEIWVTR